MVSCREAFVRACLPVVIALLLPCDARAQAPQGGAPAGTPAPGAAASGQVLTRALGLMNSGRAAEAVALLEPLTASQPQDGQAWYLLGAALHLSGQLDRALEVHTRAATFPQVRANALYNVGCVHALQGRPDAAFESLQAALADPAGPGLRAQLVADSDLASLHGDPRWEALVSAGPPRRPFVEDVTVLHAWDGATPGEQFGWEAVDAGDVDGDDVHDVLVSAPFHRADTAPGPAGASGGTGQNGRVALYSGRSGELLWERVGEPGEQLGIGISAAGDVNGDLQADVIVGASCPPSPPSSPSTQGSPGATGTPSPPGAPASPPADAPAGRAYILSGRDGALLRTLQGEAAGDQFGDQVRGLGDVDGDIRDDVAVSAPFHDRAPGAAGGEALLDAGRVTVFSGMTGKPLLVLDGERAGDHFGSALGGATGRVTASHAGWPAREGLLLVGAMDAGAGRRGRVSVYRLRAAAAAPFFDIEAEPTGSSLGQFFASVIGDIDADGVPDVYATDFADSVQPGSASGATGRLFLHSGKDGSRLANMPGRTPGEGFGIGNAQAGDVNRDGRPDLVVGAWTNSEAAPRAGKAYVLSGKDRTTLATFTCTIAGDEFGFDATGLGDINGDGATDFLLTAASNGAGGPKAGRVYVISGAGIPGALQPDEPASPAEPAEPRAR